MKRLRFILFALFVAFPVWGQEIKPADDVLLLQRLLPTVRTFIARNNLPLPSDFATNRISDFKAGGDSDSDLLTPRLMIDKKHAFSFFGTRTNCHLDGYRRVNPGVNFILGSADPEQIQALAAQTNTLNEVSARKLCDHYFQLQGHFMTNFHPVFFNQITWGNKVQDPKHYVAFPYYEAEWVRKDQINAPAEEQHTILPSVRMMISGVDSSLQSYDRLLLPGSTDFDSNQR